MTGRRANKFIGSFRHSYAATSVNSGAWLEISSALDNNVRELEIFDGSSEDLVLSVGASGDESSHLRNRVFPGGLDRQEVTFDAGQRLAISPVSGNATSGVLLVNMWGY